MKQWSQKPEVWILLVASLAIAFWALKPPHEPSSWDAGNGSDGLPATENPKMQLLGGELVRDYGNARLDLLVRLKNESIHPLRLTAPKVRLLADQREIPAFFLPAERPPEVAPKTTAEVKLRYWLEAGDLQKSLSLDVDGDSVPVKSAKAFALEPLENGQPVPLRGVDW